MSKAMVATSATDAPPAHSLGPRRDPVAVAVILSIAFHGSLVGAWLLSRHHAPRIDLDAKPIQAHLVRLGEKRPDKFLPRKDPNVPPPPPEVAQSKPTPAVVEPPKPKPPKAPPKDDLRKDLFRIFDRNKPVTKPDTVTGQADGDAAGDVDTASEGEKYFGMLSARIHRNYDVSSAISDSDKVRLQAVVVIWLSSDGSVTRTDFQTKSGNDLFDSAVLAAVQKASPFPPPPDFLKASLAKDGVALKFRP